MPLSKCSSRDLKRLEERETIECDCGRYHFIRPYLRPGRSSQPQDHPQFMAIYGGEKQSSAISGSSDLPTRQAVGNVPIVEATSSNAPTPESEPTTGAARPSNSADTGRMRSSSPIEIKVSTWRSSRNSNASRSASRTQHLSGQPVSQIVDQDWPLTEIIGARIIDGEREFKISWNESVFHMSNLNERRDGKSFVVIDGVQWDIESHEVVESDDERIRSCSIKWPATWKPEQELFNARELIDEFDKQEVERATASAREAPSESVERFSDVEGPASPSIDIEPDRLEVWERFPEPCKVPALRFKPQSDQEYLGSDFREILGQELGAEHKLLKPWTSEMDQRSLTFRPTFIAAGREFDLGRGEKRRAVLDHICGVEQAKQCECCENGAGPFAKCVVAPNSTYRACTNCSCSGITKRCNFHTNTMKEHWLPTLEQLLTPPPSSPSGDGPIDFGFSSPPTRPEMSPELGDPNFWMSPPPKMIPTAPIGSASSVCSAEVAPASLDQNSPPSVEEEPPSRPSEQPSPSGPEREPEPEPDLSAVQSNSSTNSFPISADVGTALFDSSPDSLEDDEPPFRPFRRSKRSSPSAPSAPSLELNPSATESSSSTRSDPITADVTAASSDTSSVRLEDDDPPSRQSKRPSPSGPESDLSASESSRSNMSSFQTTNDVTAASFNKGSRSLDDEERTPRRSKRRSPCDPDLSDPESSNNTRGLPIRPAKSRRLSNTANPARTRVRAEAAFCVSAADAIWRPASFRHPGCEPDLDGACTEFNAYTQVDSLDRSACQAAERVLSGHHFVVGEATDDVVRYILGKCPCNFVESFYEGWRTWTHSTSIHCGQENFLSQFYVKKLNEAMDRFCQYRIQHMNGVPVIVIE